MTDVRLQVPRNGSGSPILAPAQKAVFKLLFPELFRPLGIVVQMNVETIGAYFLPDSIMHLACPNALDSDLRADRQFIICHDTGMRCFQIRSVRCFMVASMPFPCFGRIGGKDADSFIVSRRDLPQMRFLVLGLVRRSGRFPFYPALFI